MKQKKKAQSIVEYLLVFAGIVLAVLVGANMLAQGTKRNMTAANASLGVAATHLEQKMGVTP